MARIIVITAEVFRKAAEDFAKNVSSIGDVTIYSDTDKIEPVQVGIAAEDAHCAIILWSRQSVKSITLKTLAGFALFANKVISVSIDGSKLPIELEWCNITNEVVQNSAYGKELGQELQKLSTTQTHRNFPVRAVIVVTLILLLLASYFWVDLLTSELPQTLGAIWPTIARFRSFDQRHDREIKKIISQNPKSWKDKEMKVFISSTSSDHDADFSHCIDAIRENNCDAFHYVEQIMHYEVHSRIIAKIETSDIFLLMLTPFALINSVVRAELNQAQKKLDLRRYKIYLNKSRRENPAQPLRPHEERMLLEPMPVIKKLLIFQLQEIRSKHLVGPELYTAKQLFTDYNPLKLHKIKSLQARKNKIGEVLCEVREELEKMEEQKEY